MKSLLTLIILLSLSRYAIADVKEFVEPKVDGYRMDSCLSFSKDCIKPAAMQWCRNHGFSKAIYWETSTDGVGHISPTIMLNSKEICRKAYCHAFNTIVCYKEKNRQ